MQDIQFDRLNQFPILQFAVAIIVVLGFALAIYRSLRVPKPELPPELHEQRWFFDGPVKLALDALHEINQVLVEIRADSRNAVIEFRQKSDRDTELLRDIREDLRRKR